MTEIEEGFAANNGLAEKVGGDTTWNLSGKSSFLAKMEPADYSGLVSYGCNGGSSLCTSRLRLGKHAAQMGQRRRADPTL
jgi:hypothetical protein